MHHKQHLAAATVIQRPPPSVTIVLPPATVDEIDQFIRNVGSGRGIKTRSDAIQFFLDQALPRSGKTGKPEH